MADGTQAAPVVSVFRWPSSRRLMLFARLAIVVLGPVLALLTLWVLGPLNKGADSTTLRAVILADLVYGLVVAALVIGTIARMIAARRAQSAGSRLHLRLTGVFVLVALIPTVTVAIFAGLTVNIGLEGWFSDRVREVVSASRVAAEAYEENERKALRADAVALAGFIDVSRRDQSRASIGDLRQVLGEGQSLIQRGLREAYVIDSTGEIISRGERSYLFDFERPDPEVIEGARAGETQIIKDWDLNEFRALVALETLPNAYLYVSRDVDGQILSLLDDTRETVDLYNQLESERGRLVLEFGLLYLAFAFILILAAVWLGLWFAERLARPVGRLAAAAQRVGSGDLDVQVPAEPGDDEIAMLGRVFNQMTHQLKGQRAALVENTQQVEQRRRLFDSVLSSVTAGVVGLDADGRVTFVNKSADRLLRVDEGKDQTVSLSVLVPEFGNLFNKLRRSRSQVAQEEIKVTRGGTQENLLVRMATRRGEDGKREGFVVAFDDVTDLVSAQRMAAWGDVARRIAHEIKNPLTPIQLSAERIRRKYAPMVGEESDTLEQLTDVIVRQTGDLRRIVDEFSKFARMPEPVIAEQDMVVILRDAVMLQEDALGVPLTSDLAAGPILVEVDATMISQALTNLIKNAGEAIESLHEKGAPKNHQPSVHVALRTIENKLLITVSDNGIGLPEDRARLFEPYVTTREKGTGLGLSIVKKIIEEHGGTLILTDADPLDQSGQIGARAEVRLPLAAGKKG